MILYRPDGLPFETSLKSKPRHCFLITRLGKPIPEVATEIRETIKNICEQYDYKVIDASTEITGKDFLLKIWKLIASTPLSIGIHHDAFPVQTTMNIYYELGMARSMGKETMIVKLPNSLHPSDLNRDEYIEYTKSFESDFSKFLKHIDEQADYYETMAEQLENNPLLSIDYLKRAYLITGDQKLKQKVKKLLKSANLKDRAKNSVEILAAKF
jgi:hypothetical protein